MSNPRKMTRGVRYISKALLTYYPNRYSPVERRQRAREILTEFKSQGKRPVIRAIKDAEKVVTKEKRQKKPPSGAPELPLSLSEPNNYFNLTQYQGLIKGLSSELLFESTISDPELPLIRGGTEDGRYSTYFAKFVVHMNKRRKQAEESGAEDYETDWYVKCTPPVFDRKSGKWISQIISCDSDGNENNYDFDAEKTEFGEDETGIGTEKGAKDRKKGKKRGEVPDGGEKGGEKRPDGKKGGKEPQPPTGVNDLERQIETKRQENIGEVLKALNAGILTKAEAKELIATINKK